MTPDTPSWIRLLADEHAKLARVLSQLKVSLAGDAPVVIAELRNLLEQVEVHIRAHMAYEEKDGYFVSVLEKMPNMAATLEELRGEHQTLQNELSAIRDALQRDPEQDTVDTEIVKRLQTWLHDVGGHEHRENAIVLDAFNTDIGTGD